MPSRSRMQRSSRRDADEAVRRGIRTHQRTGGSHHARSRAGQAVWVWLGVLLLVIAAAASLSWLQHSERKQLGSSEDYPNGQTAVLERVVDGDTVVVDLDGTEERVRLLNIDTPESVHPDQPVECLGPEASERISQLISPGDELILEFDLDVRDHYDRLLAGLYAGDLFVNEQMAKDGYGAPAYYEPNDRFLAVIEDAWEEAKAAGNGMFADGLPCEPEVPDYP
ncbi:thermonuclease family protein [Nesterenkonia populi]|uniref:thermonuclease family protein n=1 Tax=Nesterenkonia populi TaxID=1591087 RepID=UPI0011BF9DC0|nr:thermonuclease family protein [Nesterenkonia populi]